jgi:TonB family protein
MHLWPLNKTLRCVLFLALLAPFAPHSIAQSTEAELKTRLVNKPLYLRSFLKEDNLKFDLAGKLTTPSAHAPFPLCGIYIDSVKLQKDKLVLNGGRMGLQFKPTMDRVHIPETVQIEIAGAPGADYGPALDKIFADGLAELTPSLPTYWQPYAQKTFLNTASQASPQPSAKPQQATADAQTVPAPPVSDDTILHVAKGITAPVLLSQAQATFNNVARQMKLRGDVTLSFVVKKDGSISNVSILSPLGLGLDEQAIGALYQYRYKPAMQGATPVSVYQDVVINFTIY